jgi:hypothetical protein
MSEFDLFIEAVRQRMKPESRVEHLVGTLRQLFTVTPPEITLADIVTGWQVLASSRSQNEDASITHRRHICRELSVIGEQCIHGTGNLTGAAKAWQAWQEAFESSSEPRQFAMAKVLNRELGELQAIA